MLLLTGHARTDVTLKEIGVLPADIRRKTAKHPLGWQCIQRMYALWRTLELTVNYCFQFV